MTRDLTKAQLAEALGVTTRQVNRWLKQGLPCTREGGKPLMNADEARAWRAARTNAAAEDADDEEEGEARPGATLDTLARAELARKLTIAKKHELELAAEKGLKNLDFAGKVRRARTEDEVLEITSEACALVSSGAMTPQRGNSVEKLLARMLRCIVARRDVDGDEDQDTLLIVTREGHDLLDLFEGIVSDERRTRILEHVRGEAATDLTEHPNTDTALEPEGEGPQ